MVGPAKAALSTSSSKELACFPSRALARPRAAKSRDQASLKAAREAPLVRTRAAAILKFGWCSRCERL